MTEYKRVELDTVANIALAERLVAQGWQIIRSSIFAVLLEKKTKGRRLPAE